MKAIEQMFVILTDLGVKQNSDWPGWCQIVLHSGSWRKWGCDLVNKGCLAVLLNLTHVGTLGDCVKQRPVLGNLLTIKMNNELTLLYDRGIDSNQLPRKNDILAVHEKTKKQKSSNNSTDVSADSLESMPTMPPGCILPSSVTYLFCSSR